MNVDKIKNELDMYADAYYNHGKSLITDEEFDNLKDKYEKVSNKRYTIGAKVKIGNTVNLSHNYDNLAGTLDKVNNISEFKKWHRKVGGKFPIGVSLKYDGNSIIIEYKNGKLFQALTRGEEGVGKDLTEYFKRAKLENNQVVNDLSEIIDTDFAIAFEAVVAHSSFNKLIEKTDLNYTNPRSAVVGLLTTDGLSYSKYLSMVPLKFQSDETIDRLDQVNLIFEELSSEYNHPKLVYDTIDSYDELEKLYDLISESRGDLAYMVDGLVVELLNTLDRKNLGFTDNRPNFAVALKFPYIEKKTKVLDVQWFTEGNSARFTPVVIFEPVILNGNTYQKTSVSNYARFKEMKLRLGDDLIFSLRNEVLGYLDKPDSEYNKTNTNKLFKVPTKCNVCGSNLHIENDTFISCINQECKLVIVGKIQNFIEKLNIKGIKRKTVEKLNSLGYWNNIQDLFTFDYTKLYDIPGFGKISANTISDIFTKLKNEGIYDYELIGSLNVPLLSRDRAKIIFRNFSIEKVKDLYNKDMLHEVELLNGIGTKICESLKYALDEHLQIIEDIIKYVPIKQFSEDIPKIKNNKSLNICNTGALKNFSRDNFKKVLEKKGHTLVGSVTRKTDYLVTNDTDSSTVKYQKAIELGVKIINEEVAMQLLGISKYEDLTESSIEDLF